MTLDTLIARLTEIRAQLGTGDVPVLHPDDWADFLVERVTVEPEITEDGNRQPMYVRLSGAAKMINFDTGKLD